MNKFFLPLAALCITLQAQETKPSEPAAVENKATETKTPEVKLAGGSPNISESQSHFIEVWSAKNREEVAVFQNNIRGLTEQINFLKQLQIFLENAITTPEKETRAHEIAAKQAKLKGDNESMAKVYGGWSIERPFQLITTKAEIVVPLSNEEYKKLEEKASFDKNSVISAKDKDNKDIRYHIQKVVTGQSEVAELDLMFKTLSELYTRLGQYNEAQPKENDEFRKKRYSKAIKSTQDELNNTLKEFQNTFKFEYNPKALLIMSEAKLYIQITNEEKKQIEAKNAQANEDKKAK